MNAMLQGWADVWSKSPLTIPTTNNVDVDVTLKALLGSGGMAIAAPVIWSCIIRDWSAAKRGRGSALSKCCVCTQCLCTDPFSEWQGWHDLPFRFQQAALILAVCSKWSNTVTPNQTAETAIGATNSSTNTTNFNYSSDSLEEASIIKRHANMRDSPLSCPRIRLYILRSPKTLRKYQEAELTLKINLKIWSSFKLFFFFFILPSLYLT